MPSADTPSPSPAWKQEYPIRRSDEHRASRRAFMKFLGASLLAGAGGYLIKDQIFTHPISGPKVTVAKEGEIAIGGYKLFNYPEGKPAILIRLSEGEYVAYNQQCTHLMCPVHYQAEKQQLVCPCHNGYFDARTGNVLAGPPPRPLPRYKVTLAKGEIVVG